MVGMTEVLAKVVEGLAEGLPQAMADIYGMKRDGSAPGQLQLESDLRKDELEYESTLRVDEHMKIARGQAEIDHNPFGPQTDSAVHQEVQRITRWGERPALLFAPFLDIAGSVTENCNNPYRYLHSLRSNWKISDWCHELEADAGTIAKPLIRTDWDARQIFKVLADLPIILVNGVVREDGRPRLEILAWNILDGSSWQAGSRPISIIIPEYAAEGIEPGELPDQLSSASTQLCAMLAEWFYVARGRRPQRRHHEVARFLHRATAEGTLVALRAGIARHRLDPVTATVDQAMLCAELGDVDGLTGALDFIRCTASPDARERHLRSLRDTFADTVSTGAYPVPNAGRVTEVLGGEYNLAGLEFVESQL